MGRALKTPLTLTERDCGHLGTEVVITDANGKKLHDEDSCCDEWSIDELKDAVACVNALSGVPDPAALMAAVREVVEAKSRYNDVLARPSGITTWNCGIAMATASANLDAALRRLGEVMGK